MKYAFEMGFKNSYKSLARIVFIPFILCIGLVVIGVTIHVTDNTVTAVSSIESDYLEELRIKVIIPGNAGVIRPADENRMAGIEGVQCVCRDHYLGGAFGNPDSQESMKIGSILGIDLESQRLMIAPDYRGQAVSGVILPESFLNLVQTDSEGHMTIDTSYEFYLEEELKSISVTYPVLSFYQDSTSEEVSRYVYMTRDLYEAILQETGLFGESRSLILFLSDVDAKESVLESIRNMGYHATAEEGSAGAYLMIINVFRTVGLTIGITMVSLATLVVLQALNTSIRRREKTIGVMKAFGYRDRHMFAMLFAEISVYSILALVLSIIIRLSLANVISEKMAILFMNANYAYTLKQFAIDLGILLLFMALSMLRPLIICRKMSPVEILKAAEN